MKKAGNKFSSSNLHPLTQAPDSWSLHNDHDFSSMQENILKWIDFPKTQTRAHSKNTIEDLEEKALNPYKGANRSHC